MKALDVLIAADALLADESKWTQGDYCEDASGHGTTLRDSNAIRFCALGAIRRASLDDSWKHGAATYFRDAIGTRAIPTWNDNRHRTFPEVKAAFAKAIELARTEAA